MFFQIFITSILLQNIEDILNNVFVHTMNVNSLYERNTIGLVHWLSLYGQNQQQQQCDIVQNILFCVPHMKESHTGFGMT